MAVVTSSMMSVGVVLVVTVVVVVFVAVVVVVVVVAAAPEPGAAAVTEARQHAGLARNPSPCQLAPPCHFSWFRRHYKKGRWPVTAPRAMTVVMVASMLSPSRLSSACRRLQSPPAADAVERCQRTIAASASRLASSSPAQESARSDPPRASSIAGLVGLSSPKNLHR